MPQRLGKYSNTEVSRISSHQSFSNFKGKLGEITEEKNPELKTSQEEKTHIEDMDRELTKVHDSAPHSDHLF